MITTLTGDNHFLLQQALNELVSGYVTRFGDLGLEKLDGEEASIERLVEACQSPPFLVDKKLVILKHPSAQKAFMERIEELINDLPETIDLIIKEPKIDRRSSYYKELKAKTEYKEFSQPEGQKLNTWIVQHVKQQGGSISSSDANYLIERVGQDQQLIYQELEKLITYQPQISRATIELLTELNPQSTIFELVDSAFANIPKRTLSLYKQQRALKVEPQQIMAMLAWQLHVLAIVKLAGDKNPDEIARETKLSPFVVRKTAAIASKLSLAEVKALVRRALRLDVRMKSQNIDADEAMQHFLLTITS